MSEINEPLRTLGISRSVLNIDEEHLSRVQTSLNGPDSASTQPPERIRKLFKPPHILRAVLIGHAELLRLHARIGWNSSVDEDHIGELKEYLTEALPEFSRQPIDVPTLPSILRPTYGKGDRLILSIADSSELVNERIFAKQALHNFYRIRHEPDHVWEEDKRITGVRLAVSDNDETTEFLRRIDWALESDPSLLPAVTELSPADPREYVRNRPQTGLLIG